MTQRRSKRVSSRLQAAPSLAAPLADGDVPHVDQSALRTAASRVYGVLELRLVILNYADAPTLLNMMLLEKDGFACAAAKLWEEIVDVVSWRLKAESPRYETYRQAVRTLYIEIYPLPESPYPRAFGKANDVYQEIIRYRAKFPNLKLVSRRPVSGRELAYTARLNGDEIRVDIRRHQEIIPSHWQAQPAPIKYASLPASGLEVTSDVSGDTGSAFIPLSHQKMTVQNSYEVTIYAGPVNDGQALTGFGPEEQENFWDWMDWLFADLRGIISAINPRRHRKDWGRKDTRYTDVLHLIENRPFEPPAGPITVFEIPHIDGLLTLPRLKRIFAVIGPQLREITIEHTIVEQIKDWHAIFGAVAEAFPALEVLNVSIREWERSKAVRKSGRLLPPIRIRKPLSGLPYLRLFHVERIDAGEDLLALARNLCQIGTRECVYRYWSSKEEVVQTLIRKLRSSRPETAEAYWQDYQNRKEGKEEGAEE